MSCLNIAEGLKMSMGFLKTIKFSSLSGYWWKGKPDKPLSAFIYLSVVCSNYRFICKSEEYYEKGNWQEFEKFLVKNGWKVVGDNLFCADCYRRWLDD